MTPIRLFFAAALFAMSPAWATASDSHEHGPGMEQRLKSANGADFDSTFLRQMVHHHGTAIDLAALVNRNATHPEINEFAETIIQKQKKERGELKKMLKDAGSDDVGDVDPEMREQADEDKKAISAVPAKDIDRVFLERMAQHHRQGIAAAKLAQTKSTMESTKSMATSMIADQEKDLKQMAEWYHTWYGADLSTR